jgi:hypothetical protein
MSVRGYPIRYYRRTATPSMSQSLTPSHGFTQNLAMRRQSATSVLSVAIIEAMMINSSARFGHSPVVVGLAIAESLCSVCTVRTEYEY